jgi:hypothetical protein
MSAPALDCPMANMVTTALATASVVTTTWQTRRRNPVFGWVPGIEG